MDETKIIDESLITSTIIDTKERIRLFMVFQAQRDVELMNKVQSVADKLDEIGRGVEKPKIDPWHFVRNLAKHIMDEIDRLTKLK
jgi:hypothetical protein